MIPFRSAIECILEQTDSLSVEDASIFNSHHRVVGKTIEAPQDVPSFQNSAMDGYAIRFSDLQDKQDLSVVGEVRAGLAGRLSVKPGEAIRIMTGGEIPHGTDTVVRKEDTELISRQRIRILDAPKKGENVRLKGEDLRVGALVLEEGVDITPAAIGLLASLGVSRLAVRRKPKVHILPTGSELAEVGQSFAKPVVYNSNTPMLESMVERDGGNPRRLAIAPDDPKEMKVRLEEGLDADLLLTCGGVSVGEYDYVRNVLEQLGVKILFHKVAIKPGKPLLFGVKEKPQKCLVLGLPGNPVSTWLTYEIFVRPALRKLLGLRDLERKTIRANLEEFLPKKPGLTHFVRAILEYRNDQFYVRSTGPQGSHLLTSVVKANCLIVLDEVQGDVKVGEWVDVIPMFPMI